MPKRRTDNGRPRSTWAEIFDRVERRGEVVLRRGDRLYTLRLLDGAAASRRRQGALRVPVAEPRSGRASLTSPVVKRGFGWRWDPAGGGLRLVKR
jgi:hypothetical protein